MAATIKFEKTREAKILPFRARCNEVSRTDRQSRLPTLSSADIEDIFAHMIQRDQTRSRAA